MAIINGANTSNQLNGTNLADRIGLGGNDILIGRDGDDLLEGGADADELFGSNGFDYASYKGSPTGVYNGLAPHASVTEVRCIPRLGRCVQGTGGRRPALAMEHPDRPDPHDGVLPRLADIGWRRARRLRFLLADAEAAEPRR